jgi:hypothetical protein
MANTQINSGNVVTKFDKSLFREYVRGNGFSGFIGTAATSPIVIKEEKGGKQISIPFVTKLTGSGVSGSQTLRGNGENVGNYADVLTPTYYRHSVEFDKEEAEKPNFDIRAEARPLLMDWGMELVRDQIIDSMSAVDDGSTYANYVDASEAVKDAWLANNSDRVLFGAAKSNNSSNDHSASLANIDSTNDKLSKDILGIAKRMAQTTSQKIRPYKVKDTVYENYVMFVGSRAYRDFYNSTEVQGDLQNARERAKSNPLFMPGDLMFDNVLVREIPEITEKLTDNAALSSAGNGSIAVEPCFLVGAQAIGYALSRRPSTIADNTYDYNFQPGVAVEMKHEIRKLMFNNKQHGMVTVYVSGVADA